MSSSSSSIIFSPCSSLFLTSMISLTKSIFHLQVQVSEDTFCGESHVIYKVKEPLDQNTLDMGTFTDWFDEECVGLNWKVKHDSDAGIPSLLDHL